MLPKESRLTLTIKALKNNPKLTLRYVVTIYNIPLITLSARCDGRPVRRDIPANSHKLTDLEEKTIIQYIIKLYIYVFHPWLSYIEDITNQLLRKRNVPPISVQ